jgi:hypothetical protein
VISVQINESKSENISLALNNVLEEKKQEEEEKERNRQVLTI